MEIPMIFISLKSLTQKRISHLKFSQFFTITRKVFNTGNIPSPCQWQTFLLLTVNIRTTMEIGKGHSNYQNVNKMQPSLKTWCDRSVRSCPNSGPARRGLKLNWLPGGLRMMSPRVYISPKYKIYEFWVKVLGQPSASDWSHLWVESHFTIE